MSLSCKLCEKRRARRTCPGVGGQICAQCCGEQRENSIDCPSTCDFLKQARFHEVPPPIPADQLPNQDIRLSEKFVRAQDALVYALAAALQRGMAAGAAIDFDAREALEALIRTYRTRESGLIYETRSPNPYAAALQEKLQQGVEDIRKALAGHIGAQTLRDSDVLGALVFLQRLEYQYNNGRKRGRAFHDFLASYIEEAPATGVSA